MPLVPTGTVRLGSSARFIFLPYVCMVAALQYQSCLQILILWPGPELWTATTSVQLYRWTAANSEHSFGNSAELILGLGGPSKSCVDKKLKKNWAVQLESTVLYTRECRLHAPTPLESIP